jgi:hypothetical protein
VHFEEMVAFVINVRDIAVDDGLSSGRIENMCEKVPIRIEASSSDNAELVKGELAALLATEHFSSSRRYPAFLSHVVLKTLDGRADELKERSIGIDVFNRKPDFDTSSDTVVRFTAGEVRKRLNSIYLENPARSIVQIELPHGSYVPEFFHLVGGEEKPLTVSSSGEEVEGLAEETAQVGSLRKALLSKKVLWIGSLFFLLALGCFFWFRTRIERTSVDQFWQPVQASGSPSVVAAGAFVFSASSPTGRILAEKADEYPYMSMATTASVARLTQQFGRAHMDYVLQSSVSTTLTDMRDHPTILVGAYDNDWTLRLSNDLRFRFSPKPAAEIYDSKNPSISWTRPQEMPAYKDADDYAIVARFKDKLTENTVVIIAGIGKNGTAAATQFVTSARYLDMLNQPSSKDCLVSFAFMMTSMNSFLSNEKLPFHPATVTAVGRVGETIPISESSPLASISNAMDRRRTCSETAFLLQEPFERPMFSRYHIAAVLYLMCAATAEGRLSRR